MLDLARVDIPDLQLLLAMSRIPSQMGLLTRMTLSSAPVAR
jgi:hypothetical protein